MKTSLLMPCEDVPDDDGLRVILRVHQWAESHQVSARGSLSTALLGVRIPFPAPSAMVTEAIHRMPPRCEAVFPHLP